MRTRISLALVGSLVILPTLAGPATPAHAERPSSIDSTRSERVLLAHQFSRGQTQTFQVTAHEVMQPLGDNATISDVRMALTFTQEVQNVGADGIATIGTTIADPTFETDTQNRRALQPAWDRLRGLRTTARLESDGSVVEQLGGADVGFGALDPSGTVVDLLGTTRIEFPREAVAVGDSWIQTMPLAVTTPDASLVGLTTVRYTLAGYAPYAGREVAVIDGIYNSEIDGNLTVDGVARDGIIARGQGVGYVLFDYRAGQVLETGLVNGLVLTRTDIAGERTFFTASMTSTISAVGLAGAEGSGAAPATP